MLQRPSLSRSAAAPLAGGDVASPPPDATSATACPPHTVATPSRERRLKDERPIVTPAIAPEEWTRQPYPGGDDDLAAAALAVWTMATIASVVLAAFVVTLLALGGVL